MSASSETPPPTPSETLAAIAAQFARGAGEILLGLFGKRVEVDYKNKAKTDPVSEADTASQEFLTKAIAAKFPCHGVFGEEKPKDKDEARREGEREVPDYLWVLDPLDGTKNFLNGLAVWGCSVGVLHQGRPVAGLEHLRFAVALAAGQVDVEHVNLVVARGDGAVGREQYGAVDNGIGIEPDGERADQQPGAAARGQVAEGAERRV